MTTYDGKRFLSEMLDSLRKQTRYIDELLIFDDGSKDGTVEFIQEYIKKYSMDNWKVYRNKENLGWEKNFIQGLCAANGDVIFPCDQDDIWHLDKIEKMVGAFEANENVWLLVSGFHAFSEKGGKMVMQLPVNTETNGMVSQVVFNEYYYQVLRPGCTMAFRKEMIPLFRSIWEAGMPHDAALWTIASLLRKLYLYNDTFIDFRRHDSNASKKSAHEFKYKINEVTRTKIINKWYRDSEYFSSEYSGLIDSCDIWCDYREKLLSGKKLRYWFKLHKYRKHYLSNKKYIGDLYYYLCK